MIAAWMIYCLATTAMLAIAAILLDRLARSAQLPGRFVWVGAILTSVLLAGAVVVRPTGPVQQPAGESGGESVLEGQIANGLTTSTTRQAVTGGQAPGDWSNLSRIGAAVLSYSQGARRFMASLGNGAKEPLFNRVLGAIWIIAAAGSLIFLALSARKVSLRRAQWQRTSLANSSVLLSDSVGPAVVGLLSPDIVVPRWMLTVSAEEQRLILAHEHQHLRARDPQLLSGAMFCCALIPWNPLVWYMLRRLRRATELDCDRRVLHEIPAARSYAELLINVSSRSLPFATIGHALVDRRTDLERRVEDILMPKKRVTRVRFLFSVCMAALLTMVACLAPSPRLSPSGEAAAQPQVDTSPTSSRDSAATRATPSAPVGAVVATQSRAPDSTRQLRPDVARTPAAAVAGRQVVGAAPATAVVAVPATVVSPDARSAAVVAPAATAGRSVVASPQVAVARLADTGRVVASAQVAPRPGIAVVVDTVARRTTSGIISVAPTRQDVRIVTTPTATSVRSRPDVDTVAIVSGMAATRVATSPRPSPDVREVVVGYSPYVVGSDSLASLATKLFPELFGPSPSSDTALIAIVLDSLGNVVHSAAEPGRVTGTNNARAIIEGLFPDTMRWRYMRIGASSMRMGSNGHPQRPVMIAWGVFIPR